MELSGVIQLSEVIGSYRVIELSSLRTAGASCDQQLGSVAQLVEVSCGAVAVRCGAAGVWCGGVDVWRCGGVEVWRRGGEP